MLLFPTGTKKDEPPLEGVDGKSHLLILPDFAPGFIHFPTPVYVIKNEDAVFMSCFQAHFEVIQRGLFLMIAVEENKVVRVFFQEIGQGRIEFADVHVYILHPEPVEHGLGNSRRLRTAL